LRDGYVRILQQKEALDLGDDICNSGLDLITIARLLYIREKKHCELQHAGYCCDCEREAGGYFFSSEQANKRIDEVFGDEIAGMEDD